MHRVSGLHREVRNMTTFYNPYPLFHMSPSDTTHMAFLSTEDFALSSTDIPPTSLFPSTY